MKVILKDHKLTLHYEPIDGMPILRAKALQSAEVISLLWAEVAKYEKFCRETDNLDEWKDFDVEIYDSFNLATECT